MAKYIYIQNSSFDTKKCYLGDDWFGIVVHGGGGTNWTESFPLISHVQNYVRELYSIEIPFHGSSAPSSPQSIPSADEIISSMIETFGTKKKKDGKHKILFVGYSFGAILLMHVWLHAQKNDLIDPQSIGILIGCSFAPSNPKLLNFYKKWWQADEFERRGKAKQMEQLHGPQWRSTTEVVRSWLDGTPLLCEILPLTENSAIWLKKEASTELFNLKKNPNLFFIVGEEDQVFPVMELTSLLPLENVAKRVLTVPSDHFSYFTTAWVSVQRAINLAVTVSTSQFTQAKAKL